MTFRLQEPEAPFQNATSRDWQKAFNPQRELGLSAAGSKTSAINFLSIAALLFLFLLSACNPSFKLKPLDDKEFWESGYKVLFAGDFSYGDTYEQGNEINKKHGYDYSLAKIAPFLNSADYSIVNLETPITDIDIKPYKNLKKCDT
jgi:hypothetical protein